ncbi:MAG: hypothetical protein LT071_09955 [Nocardioides sp.]|nr:hypothetical protein [Nocardioides sp.]
MSEVDDYIAGFPPEVRARLNAVREAALEVVPEPGEKISYGVPTVTTHGKNVFHYAAYDQHLSTYPVPEAADELAAWIDARRKGKGTLHHPHDEPLSLEHVTELVRLLVDQRA